MRNRVFCYTTKFVFIYIILINVYYYKDDQFIILGVVYVDNFVWCVFASYRATYDKNRRRVAAHISIARVYKSLWPHSLNQQWKTPNYSPLQQLSPPPPPPPATLQIQYELLVFTLSLSEIRNIAEGEEVSELFSEWRCVGCGSCEYVFLQ